MSEIEKLLDKHLSQGKHKDLLRICEENNLYNFKKLILDSLRMPNQEPNLNQDIVTDPKNTLPSSPLEPKARREKGARLGGVAPSSFARGRGSYER